MRRLRAAGGHDALGLLDKGIHRKRADALVNYQKAIALDAYLDWHDRANTSRWWQVRKVPEENGPSSA